jgi:hypothetical protein
MRSSLKIPTVSSISKDHPVEGEGILSGCICLRNSTKYRADIAMQSPLYPNYLHATGVPNNSIEHGAWSIESKAK